MAALEELGTHLQSLQALKPPGVTKSKIDSISKLCVDNVQAESTIVQKIVQQFRNSPVTHKLGVLYVVDTVTRQWVEKARASGQAVSKNAAPGTFAAGVQRITDALPSLMTELAHTAPDNQKEKISKLLDIWERGQTFPANILSRFKQQLNKPQTNGHTPPGNPSKAPTASLTNGHHTNPQPVAPPAPTAAPADTGSLLTALANLGQQNGQANPPPTAPPAVSFPQGIAPPPIPSYVPPPPFAAYGQALPPPPPGGNDLVQQIFAAIAAGVIPQDQAMTVLAAVAQAQQNGSVPMIPPPPQPPVAANTQPIAQNSTQPERYEQNGNGYRDRSRSPDFNRRRPSPSRKSPPNRRDSPTYGVYDPNAGAEGNAQKPQDRERGRGRGRNRGRGQNSRDDYRQRTPPAQRRQPSPSAQAPRNGQPKLIEWDYNMPRDHIKVLSRTLFIGGAGGTEGEIRNIFSRFGKVQTCIVNQEKRHAFVKMLYRRDAVSAKEGMDNISDPNALSKARQTRWGVGFGPRDCCDYETGISVIPIARLTDADHKWVVTAEFGGTGGRPLEAGMVLEEPDIEIGAGVSSKAISRRVPPDGNRGRGRAGGGGGGGGGGGNGGGNGSGGGGGHHEQAPHGGFNGGSRSRKQDRPPPMHAGPRHISPRPEPAVAVPPTVPSFGFQLPGM